VINKPPSSQIPLSYTNHLLTEKIEKWISEQNELLRKHITKQELPNKEELLSNVLLNKKLHKKKKVTKRNDG
jgi:hypothetical protein